MDHHDIINFIVSRIHLMSQAGARIHSNSWGSDVIDPTYTDGVNYNYLTVYFKEFTKRFLKIDAFHFIVISFEWSYHISECSRIDNYAWQHRDLLILFAAGNDGDNGFHTVTAPATAKV